MTGTQIRLARCQDGEGHQIREEQCFRETRPIEKRTCTTKRCKLRWKHGEWKQVIGFLNLNTSFFCVDRKWFSRK